MFDITLKLTADNTGRVKLGWTINGFEDGVETGYFVERSNLVTASNEVRKCLRRLVQLPISNRETNSINYNTYSDVMRELLRRGGDLYDSLFDINDPESIEIQDILSDIVRKSQGDNGRQPRLYIIIDAGTPHVPWNFVCAPDTCLPEPINYSLSDFAEFWLSQYKITLRYPGGRLKLPDHRQQQHECIHAIHETLFERSREEIRRFDVKADEKISMLLSSGFRDSRWTNIKEYFKRISESSDSTIYVFGHSDGKRLVLDDRSAIDSELPVSSFQDTFRKRPDTRSASICILNGCRTLAPDERASDSDEALREDRWPSGFRRATRLPGFYGFIGTETEVLNVWACLYGSQLLSLLSVDGLSLDEAFELLKHDKTTFPTNLVYTCCAQRDFRVSAVALQKPEVRRSAP